MGSGGVSARAYRSVRWGGGWGGGLLPGGLLRAAMGQLAARGMCMLPLPLPPPQHTHPFHAPPPTGRPSAHAGPVIPSGCLPPTLSAATHPFQRWFVNHLITTPAACDRRGG